MIERSAEREKADTWGTLSITAGLFLVVFGFSNADLHHAVMVFADISRANFTGASLRQADLSGAHRPNTRGLELTAVAKGATA